MPRVQSWHLAARTGMGYTLIQSYQSEWQPKRIKKGDPITDGDADKLGDGFIYNA